MARKGLGRLILDGLAVHGFSKTVRRAKLTTSELVWLVEVDQLPGRPLGVLVGCDVKRLTSDAARNASACQIYIVLENLPLPVAPTPSLARFDDFRSFTLAALSSSSPASEAEQTLAVSRIVHVLADFIHSTVTERELRAHVQRGVFDAGFVRREFRERDGNG